MGCNLPRIHEVLGPHSGESPGLESSTSRSRKNGDLERPQGSLGGGLSAPPVLYTLSVLSTLARHTVMFVDCTEQVHSSNMYLLNTYYVPGSRQHSERTHTLTGEGEGRVWRGGSVTDTWGLTSIWTLEGVDAVRESQSLRISGCSPPH